MRVSRSSEWHLSCKRCRYARHTLGELGARTKASSHCVRTGHSVAVWEVDIWGETRNKYETGDRQLSFDDIPPF